MNDIPGCTFLTMFTAGTGVFLGVVLSIALYCRIPPRRIRLPAPTFILAIVFSGFVAKLCTQHVCQ